MFNLLSWWFFLWDEPLYFIAFFVIMIILIVVGHFLETHSQRRAKIKLGVIQVLNDGAIVESKDEDIRKISFMTLKYDTHAHYFMTFLTKRESDEKHGNWHGLVSYYLCNWELNGNVNTDLTSEEELVVSYVKQPVDPTECELYNILKNNDLLVSKDFNNEEFRGWLNSVLAAAEKSLIESGHVAFDKKGRVRFTKKGYKVSLEMGGFLKYWENLGFFRYKQLYENQKRYRVGYALLFELYETLDKYSIDDEFLDIAKRVSKF